MAVLLAARGRAGQPDGAEARASRELLRRLDWRPVKRDLHNAGWKIYRLWVGADPGMAPTAAARRLIEGRESDTGPEPAGGSG